MYDQDVAFFVFLVVALLLFFSISWIVEWVIASMDRMVDEEE
jgi:hypothetical protein|tara:strand:- start:537 stop:662 length:126 start_codon:yes stop_codon:yes gene_type:complete